MNPREERLVRNESLFREVNERISEVSINFEVTGRVDYLCECGLQDCLQAVPLTHAEYESVRSSPTHFVLAPGHEQPAIERVVKGNGRFIVVEKIGEAGGEADEADPRS